MRSRESWSFHWVTQRVKRVPSSSKSPLKAPSHQSRKYSSVHRQLRPSTDYFSHPTHSRQVPDTWYLCTYQISSFMHTSAILFLPFQTTASRNHPNMHLQPFISCVQYTGTLCINFLWHAEKGVSACTSKTTIQSPLHSASGDLQIRSHNLLTRKVIRVVKTVKTMPPSACRFFKRSR